MPIIVRRSIRYRSVPRSSGPTSTSAARSPTRPPLGVPQTRERRARSPPQLSVSLRNKLAAEDRPGSSISSPPGISVVPQPPRRDPARIQDDNLAIEAPLLVSVDFEVFGETQGTYFLKYARDMCDKLGLKGWVRLSKRGTVIGQIQGEKSHVDEMALWLRLQGAPGSRIDHTEFTNWSIIDRLDYKTFTMRF